MCSWRTTRTEPPRKAWATSRPRAITGATSACRSTRERRATLLSYTGSEGKRYIEEFSVSNFIGIKDNTYVTPDSPTILRSATNDMLMDLAASDAFGMKVERRPVDVNELGDFPRGGRVWDRGGDDGREKHH